MLRVQKPKKTLLLVDDNQNYLYAFSQILSREGYNIRTAANGSEALSILSDVTPDLVLCDLMMPGMSGFEVKEQMNHSVTQRDVPLIYVTARTSSSDQVKAVDIGATDYITKPFDVDELLERIVEITSPQLEIAV